MAEDVQIKQIPAQLALVARKRAKAAEIGQAMGEAFGVLMQHAQATGAAFAGPPFSLYPEMPSAEFTFLVGIPVIQGAVAGEGVELQELPAVEAATFLHKGPYVGLPSSWGRIMAWVGTSGRNPGGPAREVYLNDPDEVAEADLLTELVVPLA